MQTNKANKDICIVCFFNIDGECLYDKNEKQCTFEGIEDNIRQDFISLSL
jgi:hypothetical protein